MFYEGVRLYYNEGTSLSVLFSNGVTKRYDVMDLAKTYKPLLALKDRKLFLKGKLNWYGITWTDELDIGTDTIYYEGTTEENREDAVEALLGFQVQYARLKKELTQEGLSNVSKMEYTLLQSKVA